MDEGWWCGVSWRAMGWGSVEPGQINLQMRNPAVVLGETLGETPLGYFRVVSHSRQF